MNRLPPGLIVLTLPDAPVAMVMHQELLVKDMVLTPPPKCKSSTTLHLAKLFCPVPIKRDQMAWLHNHFRPQLIPQETSDWSKVEMVVMREQGDMSKIIETPLAQMTEIRKEDAPLMPVNKSMIPGGLPVKTGGTAIPVTNTSMVNKTITDAIPLGQLQRTKIGMRNWTELRHL